MKTITRSFISNTFFANDLANDIKFDKLSLSKNIDYWKYILVTKFNAKYGESIIIGHQNLNIDYLATIYAAAELSLKIVIIDYIRQDNFNNLNFVDPKTKVLSPIDIFIHDWDNEYLEKELPGFEKFNFFKRYSNRTYSIINDIESSVDIDQDEFNRISNIQPRKDDILIKATSSGTTNTPKVIEHTHEFIHAVSLRNTQLYKTGNAVVHVKNLNHGASAAVTLFPAIASDDVSQHFIYSVDEDEPLTEFVELLSPYRNEVSFLSFPYPYLTDKFVESSDDIGVTWPNLNLLTLSYIVESAKHAVRDKKFKSIVSIFGSTETIGPVFTNYITTDRWDCDSRYFKKVDDFYKIDLSNDGKISITPPVYNSPHITNDYFTREDEFFVHQGRSDLVRINGEHFDLATINKLNKENDKFYIVVDTVSQCLYLAYWEDISQEEINSYITEIENNFKRITVNKSMQLIKKSFYYGIKLDNELLREYFRNHIT